MKNIKIKSSETSSLRQKAEGHFYKKTAIKSVSRTEADTVKLLHELEVHHVELEMQNEELRLARDKAEKATAKLVAIYDFAPVGYFTLKGDGTISELNLSGARMLGKERLALINRNFRVFITRDTLAPFNDFLLKVLKTSSKQTCEIKLALRNDHSSIVYIEGIVSEDEEKCLITAVDITEHHMAEEKLQNSETRYRRLFESAKDGILILDAESGQIVDVNPFLIEMIGYTKDELLGKELWELGIFKNIAASKEAFIELQHRKYIRFEEMPLETKKGNVKEVEFVSNVYLEDNIKVIQCNIRDITDRKQVESALKENETRLHELNVTKDKFFSIMAHDLRSPFSSIIGFSNLLAEQVHAKDYEGIEEYAEMIQNSSWRAMDLLTNLIEWSRSQTGRMEFCPEYIEFVALINEITTLSNDLAVQKSITISRELPHNITVFADKAMISTVLRNLISNAIKYSHPGSGIVISAKQQNNELMVTVSDNGVGLKKEAIEKLFRIEESTSTMGTQKEKGTGLGLLLCKEFISMHEGRIWVDSNFGKGSKFTFTIPGMGIKGRI